MYTNIIAISWFSRKPDRFMLLPISFVVVNFIRVVNDPYIDKSFNLWSDSDICNMASSDSVSSSLLTELVHCSGCRPGRFHCRVGCIKI